VHGSVANEAHPTWLGWLTGRGASSLTGLAVARVANLGTNCPSDRLAHVWPTLFLTSKTPCQLPQGTPPTIKVRAIKTIKITPEGKSSIAINNHRGLRLFFIRPYSQHKHKQY
jgi:hypothetical protein